MTKKNSLSFIEPQRQSEWAIIFIILRFLRKFLMQIWPILAALVLGRSRNSEFDTFELVIAGLGVFSLISSILAYFRYYFHISDEELVIQKGILKKVRLDLPFDRIQSVNFSQNFLHQMLNVTAVEIESAGSDQKELKIDALQIPVAEKLREELLKRKGQITVHHTEDTSSEETLIKPISKEIMSLDIQSLIKVGLTQNHLKPIGLIISLIASIWATGFAGNFDPRVLFDFIMDHFEGISSIVGYGIIALLLVPLMVLWSVVNTILRHYNLSFTRSGRRFHVEQGLLTKQQFSAMDKKIQIMSWGQNPLEKILGYHNIFFRQAKSGEDRKNKQRFEIPGCTENHVTNVKNAWLKKSNQSYDVYHSVSDHMFKHTAKYQCVFFGLIIIGLAYAQVWPAVAAALVIGGISLYFSWKRYTKKRYALNEDNLFIGGGILGFKNSICPIYKIQNLAIHQNYYQHRRGLATLIIHTAAGAMSIPYIPKTTAQQLMDRLINQVESSKRSWM